MAQLFSCMYMLVHLTSVTQKILRQRIWRQSIIRWRGLWINLLWP